MGLTEEEERALEVGAVMLAAFRALDDALAGITDPRPYDVYDLLTEEGSL